MANGLMTCFLHFFGCEETAMRKQAIDDRILSELWIGQTEYPSPFAQMHKSIS